MKAAEVLEKVRPLIDLKVTKVQHDTGTAVIPGKEDEEWTFRARRHGQALPVTTEAMVGLAKLVGVPENLMGKLPSKLYGDVATQLLSDRGEYAITTQGGMVQSFLHPAKSSNMPVQRALVVIDKAIPDVDFARVMTSPNHVIDLEVIAAQEKAVRPGDLVRAGALVRFSPIGTVLPVVQSYVQRLSCVNGATSNDVIKNFTGGEGDDLWQWFRRSVRAATRALDSVVTQWQNLLNETITPQDRAMMLAALIKQARLSGMEREAVEQKAIEEPPQNAYELMNIMTWAGSHVAQDPVTVRRIRGVAQDFAHQTTHARVCPVCRKEQ